MPDDSVKPTDPSSEGIQSGLIEVAEAYHFHVDTSKGVKALDQVPHAQQRFIWRFFVDGQPVAQQRLGGQPELTDYGLKLFGIGLGEFVKRCDEIQSVFRVCAQIADAHARLADSIGGGAVGGRMASSIAQAIRKAGNLG